MHCRFRNAARDPESGYAMSEALLCRVTSYTLGYITIIQHKDIIEEIHSSSIVRWQIKRLQLLWNRCGSTVDQSYSSRIPYDGGLSIVHRTNESWTNLTQKTEMNDLLTHESHSAAPCCSDISFTRSGRWSPYLIPKRSCNVNPVVPVDYLRCREQFFPRHIMALLNLLVKPLYPFLIGKCYHLS